MYKNLRSEARILTSGDAGFGILIESDAGYIDRTLNPDLYNKLITESLEVKDGEPILVNCILQKYGVKNKNGRIYPKSVLQNEVARYMELVNANSAIAEADHPESSVISLDNVSHNIKKMWWGNGENAHILYGTLEIITSPGFHKLGICSMIGDKILVYLMRGIRLGISSRGVGSLKEVRGENIVQSDFELIGFDLVHSPSTPGAYLMTSDKIDTTTDVPEIKSTNGIFEKRRGGLFESTQTNIKFKKIEDKLNKFL